jgi:hypothetical protein
MADDLQPTGNIMKAIAESISAVLPGCGFVLLMFTANEPTKANYISNANRDDMITAMKEFIARAEGTYHDGPTTKQ